MNWLEQFIQQISFFELVVKGLFIGVVVSAPMGPVGVLCLQRTLNKGRWYGFMTGLGASLSDLLYAIITAYGMSFVYDFIENAQTMFYLQLIGSVMLFAFGLYTFRSNPVKKLRPTPTAKGTLTYNAVTAFMVTVSNPLIIFLYVAMFARLSFVLPELPKYEQVGAYISIWIGALLWWFFITFAVSRLRRRFDVRGIWVLNRIIGSVVMLMALAGAFVTLTGIYSLH